MFLHGQPISMASKCWRSPANVSSHDLLLPNLLILVSLVIFALGFFPYKAFLPGHASFTADEASLAQQAPFDKVVFMVVDALRRFDNFLLVRWPWLSRTVTSSFRIVQASALLNSRRAQSNLHCRIVSLP